MKNILMIAYHFPPVRVSSGIQRTLKFARYLLDHDWKAQVLTVHPRVYERVSEDQMHEIPAEVVVRRAFALDTSKHLSIKGRYPGWLALPDRWLSWCIGGVPSGLTLVFQYRPKIIWSTYPIATAHLLGLVLHKLTGLPWVADFRDSMTEDKYPTDPTQRRFYRWIERLTINHCSRAVFTTPGAIRMYKERYPTIPEERWALIANGYDEENFVNAESSQALRDALRQKPNKTVLLHSGVLYPSERDPTQFFQALAELLAKGVISPNNFMVIFRATGHDDSHAQAIQYYGLGDVVFLEPSIGYEDALAEMLAVDGLLVFQAANCNHQIPAKLYEYIRAQKPILALTDPNGDTASILKEAGIFSIAPLDNKNAISALIEDFVRESKNVGFIANEYAIEAHSRRAGTLKLSKLLDEIS